MQKPKVLLVLVSLHAILSFILDDILDIYNIVILSGQQSVDTKPEPHVNLIARADPVRVYTAHSVKSRRTQQFQPFVSDKEVW